MLQAFKQALAELSIQPEEIAIVSGIGQSGKFPHYLKSNMINGIHGRTLPVATGIRLANHGLKVVAVAGDGDCYGEGGNHLLAALRKNPDLTLVVHNQARPWARPAYHRPGMKTLLHLTGCPIRRCTPWPSRWPRTVPGWAGVSPADRSISPACTNRP
jgi:thiamine pyrophosphate-dependent acetolactate synthase large subunit-like protein